MKMFIWANPYRIPYGTSYFYAVAETVEDARALAVDAKAFAYGEFKQEHTEKFELGEPTRVLDLPCAEVVFWEE